MVMQYFSGYESRPIGSGSESQVRGVFVFIFIMLSECTGWGASPLPFLSPDRIRFKIVSIPESLHVYGFFYETP